MPNEDRWSSEEINYLKKNKGRLIYQEISKVLERTIGAVKKKAYDLGISDGARGFKPSCVNNLKKEDWGYLAGVVDSDGCLGLRNKKNSTLPRISIVNTNKEWLNQIRELINAGYVNVMHLANGNFKTSYRLDIQRINEIKDVLENIIPYLKGKRKQGEILLKLSELVLSRKLDEKTSKRIRQQIKGLNKRGREVRNHA